MLEKLKETVNIISKAEFYYKSKRPYSTIPNSYLKDKELSLKAKGLFTIMHALPEDWDFTIKGLCEITGCGEKQVKNTIQELIEKNYITRSKKRLENGQFKYKYYIWDEKTDTRYYPY